jgi:prophage regulatory protein
MPKNERLSGRFFYLKARTAMSQDDDQYLRLPEVKARVPVAKSTLYLWINQGRFPAPRSLGGNCVGWLKSEVLAWMQSRAVASMGADDGR